jgi:hypothetical protein
MAKQTIQVDTSSSLVDGLAQVGAGLERTPHYRTAYEVNRRDEQVMTWRLPNGSAVQMYINPENFVVRDSKQITETRTKGGFVIQYWGENLTKITLSGTTGSSGIRGINVLRDIYRSENRGFELIAAQLVGDIEQVKSNLSLSTDPQLGRQLEYAALELQERNFLLRPSLASLAINVLLFYQGVQYKGFFNDFAVTESVSKLGLFDYAISFTSVETRGQRKNFMGWHKEPLADDVPGQIINGIGNAVRGFFGLSAQPPESFHPAQAPSSFGQSSLAPSLGITLNNEEKAIFL